MMTLYHAPNSRSSSIVALIEELGAPVDIRQVDIPRQDGSGRRDPANPHPEGKVPLLLDSGTTIRERGAIILYLTDRFPEAGLAPVEGDAMRGACLSWLFWYHAVLEPTLVFRMIDMTHPALDASFRDFATALDRLRETLEQQPYLLGERYSAVDLLCSSPFQWMPDLLPAEDSVLRDWVARCNDRPAIRRMAARDRSAA